MPGPFAGAPFFGYGRGRIRFRTPCWSLVLFLAAVGIGRAGETSAAAKKVVIPFDFVSRFDEGRYGQIMGELVWKRLAKQPEFIVPDSIEDVRETCRSNRVEIGPDTPLEKVGEVVRKQFDAQIGIWGSVERAPGTDGEIYDLVIRCVDFSGSEPVVLYEKTGVRTNSVSEIPHVYINQIVEKLTGRAVAAPATERVTAKSAEAEERWKRGPHLVAGDFETVNSGVPKGWEARAGQLREPLGNLVKWLPEVGNPANHLIRFTFSQAVGDNEGVMYYSRPFPVEEGATYRFQCRWRSNGPAVKVFIKCYDQSPTEFRAEAAKRSAEQASQPGNPPQEEREVYRSQQNLTGAKNAWHVHTEDFTPKSTRYAPRWGRVMLYAYLGAGVVEFDDVVVKQVVSAPRSDSADEPRHSAASKVTLEDMRANERGEPAKTKPKKSSRRVPNDSKN